MNGEFILIIEDDQDIQRLLSYNLQRAGYRTQVVDNGEEGIGLVRDESPGLVVLDLMLPGMDGIDACRVLKKDPDTKSIPVLILTAKGEEEDILAGFEAGADDYVTKPFSPKVLLARVAAALRRRTGAPRGPESVLRYQEITIHPGRHEVLVEEQGVELTRTEFQILHYLASRPGWVFTRRQIIRAVHGEDYPTTMRAVDVQVAALRKKLGPAGRHLETVRGVGYKLGD